MSKQYTILLILFTWLFALVICSCSTDRTKVRVISTNTCIVLDDVKDYYSVGDTVQIGLQKWDGWVFCNYSSYIDTAYPVYNDGWLEHRVAIIEKVYQ